MRLNPVPESLTADDTAVRAGLADAPPPPLLATVAQVTGDYSLLRDDLRPDPTRFIEPGAGYSPEQAAEARAIAADALIAWRNGGCRPAPRPEGTQLRRIIEWINGGAVADELLPLLIEELALDGVDLRAPNWHRNDVAPDTPFRVAVIGAGMSGILAAHRLDQAGIDVVILEKNSDVGGTWLENDYPGCRVDIPNDFYSYACAQTPDWPQFYSTQPVLLEYFRTCVEEFGLRDRIRLETEVVEAVFDDAVQCWRVHTRSADGTESVEEYAAVVSAVGQLNRPLMPEIPGIETFAGPWFHSARWDHSVELHGKRVGVIGTGASAAQFIPVVAEWAEHTTVFQRTPPWLLPVPSYQDAVPESLGWLMRHFPQYTHWDRLWLFARTNEGLLPMAAVDPDWPDRRLSVGPLNDVLRQLLTGALQMQVGDPELFAQLLPQYPPTAKRVVLDNGSYPAALQRDDVTLLTTGITEITERGVRTADGVEHEFDVIVYGTGFQASKFLTPMRVTGVGGADLHERWGGDARAYLGIVVPEFPNLFMMYGPNTNIVINGSIIYFSECETRFIVESVRMLLERGLRSMDCRPEVHDAYNERIDAGNRMMSWGDSDVNSWYKNEFGRVAQNWPFNLYEYWQQTAAPNPEDFVLR